MTETTTKKPSWDELSINGVPSTSLSSAGQKLFQKILGLQEECSVLSRQFDQKQAALRELSDLVMEEVTALQDQVGGLASEAVDASMEASSAQETSSVESKV